MVGPGWTDPDPGMFSISVAAELAGLHPQTPRIYEREGLLAPARSPGGTRRYSSRDISRLQEICTLTADGLNLAGIRRVLTDRHGRRAWSRYRCRPAGRCGEAFRAESRASRLAVSARSAARSSSSARMRSAAASV